MSRNIKEQWRNFSAFYFPKTPGKKAQMIFTDLKKAGRMNVFASTRYQFSYRDVVLFYISTSVPQASWPTCFNSDGMYTHLLTLHDTGVVVFVMPSNFVAFTSLFVQSLLDLVVDSALEVVDAFHEKILQLEYDVLMKPDTKVVSRCSFLFVLTTPKTGAYYFRRAALLSPTGKVVQKQKREKVKGLCE
ncbi:hypothetical protein BDR03DRAFT_980894 [Suillus americanus]|nr:hypothetical protein BDR03DRAFT_980894 [Suillus americanus]